MFNGPTRTGSLTGAMQSPMQQGTIFNGTGDPDSSIHTGIYETSVGLGNIISIFVNAVLLPPENPTDIKWIEFYPTYDGGSALSSPRFPLGGAIRGRSYSNMDVVPERDGRRPGTNLHVHRFIAHRFPNPADPENKHPEAPASDLAIGWQPCHVEPAVGDYLFVRYRFIAVDRDETPVPRVGESVQFGFTCGSYAYTY